MPAYSTASALPVQELSVAIVEGEGAVNNLIGGKVLGDLPITWRNAHIVKATLAGSIGLRQIAADKWIHAPGARFERIVGTFGEADITVTPRGVEMSIPNEMILDYRNRFDVLSFFAGRFGSQISALTKEKLIADAIFNTTNLGAAVNSTVPYTVANSSTNSFISDVITAIRTRKAAGEAPDTIVMSGPVYERIRQAAPVQAYVSGTLYPGADTTLNNLQKVFAEYGIRNVLIGDAYYNNAADGATASLSQIWSNTYIAVFKAGMQPVASQTDGVSVPTISGIGANVYWEGYSPGGVPSADKDAKTYEGGNYVEMYPDLPTDSQVIRLKMSQKPYVLNSAAGGLIATQYS